MRELFAGRRGRVAAGLLVAEFVAATQGLVIAAIMPRVVADLHGLSEYALAFGSFFAAFLLFLPFAGPWADRFGLRRVLSIAFALLGAGLAFVAVAPNMPVFISARFVEGIGDGLDYAVSFAAIAKTFPEAQRARMLSLTAAAWVVPALIAPGLGALVTTLFGWRWAFAGLLPLLAIAAALLLPAVDDRQSRERPDAFSALRLLFARATLTARHGLHAAFLGFALLHAAFFGADAYAALMLTSVRGLSLETASLCITLAALGWSIAALVQSALIVRLGIRRIVGFAALFCFLGAGGLTSVALGAPIWLAFVAWTIGGAGMGFGYPAISNLSLGEADPGREGAVSSATLLAGIVGIIAGVLFCGAPVTIAIRSGASLNVAMPYTFGLAALFAALLAAMARRIARD